jgi:hypothetical protein
MTVSVSFALAADDMKSATRDLMRHSGMGRMSLAVGVVIPVVMIALAVLNSRNQGRLLSAIWPWVIMFPALYFGLLALTRRWAVRRVLRDDASTGGVQERQLDDRGLTIVSPGLRARYRGRSSSAFSRRATISWSSRIAIARTVFRSARSPRRRWIPPARYFARTSVIARRSGRRKPVRWMVKHGVHAC